MWLLAYVLGQCGKKQASAQLHGRLSTEPCQSCPWQHMQALLPLDTESKRLMVFTHYFAGA